MRVGREHGIGCLLPARVLVVRHRLPELVPAEAEQDWDIHDLFLVLRRGALKMLQVHIEGRGKPVPVDLRLAVHR